MTGPRRYLAGVIAGFLPLSVLALGPAEAASPSPSALPAVPALVTKSVTLSPLPPTLWRGEPERITIRTTGAVGRLCTLQRARSGGPWNEVGTVRLDRRGRGISSVANATWNLGAWNLRAACGGIRSAIATTRLADPPPLTAVQVEIVGSTPSFSHDVSDYVVRCTNGRIPVQVTSPAGIRVGVDRAVADAGTFSRSVQIDPNEAFTIRLLRAGVTRTYNVRCLPDDFPALTVEGRGTAEWYLSSIPFGAERTDYVFVLDRRGTPVWWLRDSGRPTTTRLWTRAELRAVGVDAPYGVSWFRNGWIMVSTLGGVTREFPEWLDRHDLQPTERSTYYALRYQKRNCDTTPSDCVDMTRYGGGAADTVDDGQVIEVNSSGRVIWRWSSADHVALAESDRYLRMPDYSRDANGLWDLVHLNTVEPVGSSAVLITARNLDAVLKVDKASGEIMWKLGGTRTDRSLDIVGLDDELPLAGPHDARLLPDGTVTVFDNGSAAGRVARSLRFRIDEQARTATLIEQVADPRSRTSSCCGSTRRLASGNWLTVYGGSTLISEVQPDGAPVFSVNTEERSWAYRMVPVESGVVPVEAWRTGMSAMHPRGA